MPPPLSERHTLLHRSPRGLPKAIDNLELLPIFHRLERPSALILTQNVYGVLLRTGLFSPREDLLVRELSLVPSPGGSAR